jgi:DNA processing protein
MLQTEQGRHQLSFEIGKPIRKVDWSRFDQQLEAIELHKIGVVTFRDRCFPEYLRDIPQAPPILFYKGEFGLLDRRGIAIVGSRNASMRGRQFAMSLASDLAECDVMVASGLARGIDTAAHRGSLVRGGPTVAVVATGLDRVYPSENAALSNHIARDGCIMTEQLMGSRPAKFVFPRRNRLISAISRMVVVVEATPQSGALVTAKWAIEQGRDVGAVPGFPGDARSRGANRLLRQGAAPIEGIQDVLDAVPLLEGIRKGSVGGLQSGSRIAPAQLNDEFVDVFGALSSSPADADALAADLNKPVADVQRILLDLEMRGLVARDTGGGYYRQDGR